MSTFILGKKIVLIDKSDAFRSMMLRFAESRGINLTCFRSVLDMGSIGGFIDYDVAIVEADGGDLSGIEIGEYLLALIKRLPVILISSGITPTELEQATWPLSIQGFVHKYHGADEILDRALTAQFA